MATTSGSVFTRAGRPFLYVKFKDPQGRWVMRATKFRPGQEAEARAELVRLAAPPEATVASWATTWLERRREGIQDASNDEARLRDHVLPAIGTKRLEEVTPAHLAAIVEAMKKKELAPRTIRNVYSVARAMFRDACIEGLLQTSPAILTHRQLGKVRDAKLGWRASAVFTRLELEVLIGDPRLPLCHRVLWGLLGVAGLRAGEACALRWGQVRQAKPLARIVVLASNDRETTKTETERWVPVHPVLEELLEAWKYTWEVENERFYTEEDLVLSAPEPVNRGPRKPRGAMLDKNWIWKRLQADLRLLGFRNRRAHDLRRTFISLAKADGAQEYILRRATHAPPRAVMEMYTSVEWQALCAEVSKLSLTRRRAEELPAEDPDLTRMFRL